MIINVKVLKDNDDIEIFEGVSQKNGKPFKMVSQSIFAELGGPFPERISVNIPDETKKLKVGDYSLSIPFKINERNQLEIDSRKLFENIGPKS
jgi:hypothetical protein